MHPVSPDSALCLPPAGKLWISRQLEAREMHSIEPKNSHLHKSFCFVFGRLYLVLSVLVFRLKN